MSSEIHQLALSSECEKLLSTIPLGVDREAMRKNMIGFDRLFMKYLVSDAGPSIKWDGITPPPSEKLISFADIESVEDQEQVACQLNKVSFYSFLFRCVLASL